MSRLFYRAEPVHEDIYIVVEQATHDGPLYEVDECRGWEAACVIIDRLNATAEGLRRLGVAVAVWGAMAAARISSREEFGRLQTLVVAWQETARDLVAECESAVDDLAAERADRRKWELRLRARATRTDPFYGYGDRLQRRNGTLGNPAWIFRHVPIAGPRGVLP